MTIHYESRRRPGRPTIIFGSSLGTDGSMWEPQVSGLSHRWNTVTFDLPGHGRSSLLDVEPTIDEFADAVIAVADELQLDRFVYCGLSIGGAIGQSLGARYADRLDALVLASTGLTILTPDALRARAARVRAEGMDWIAELSVPRWFADEFRSEHPDIVAQHMQHMRQMDPEGYAHACLSLASFNGRDLVGAIRTPTLVIAGQQDVATPPTAAADLATAISTAHVGEIPGGSHLCNVERPDDFNALVVNHLDLVDSRRSTASNT